VDDQVAVAVDAPPVAKSRPSSINIESPGSQYKNDLFWRLGLPVTRKCFFHMGFLESAHGQGAEKRHKLLFGKELRRLIAGRTRDGKIGNLRRKSFASKTLCRSLPPI
jgi:hypothetical protein